MKAPAARLTPRQTRLLRLRAQRLHPARAGTPISPGQVLQEILAVQAQELPAARLSIRARSAGLSAHQVEQARQAERSIVWTWGLRGSLHLISAEAALWLIPLLGPGLIAASQRRFLELGWDAERAAAGLRLLQNALEQHQSLTRPEVIRLLEKGGLPCRGQAPFHLLYRAALEGILCYGPDRGKEPTYVLLESWLAAPQPEPREKALAKLAGCYLEAYGPAAPEDLAHWSGLKLSEARTAWQGLDGQLVEVEAAGKPAWLFERQLPWLGELEASAPAVRLLPRFDTYLLGYASRDLTVDPAYARRIHPGGGIIHQALLVDGRARGTWKTKRQKGRLEVLVEPFEPLAEAILPEIEVEVADLARFLGEQAVLKFPS